MVEKTRLLQLANSNQVDENIRLTVQLEAEDSEIGITDETRNGMLADEETNEFKLCNGPVSEDGLPESRGTCTSTWKRMENDANTNSSEVSREQEVGIITRQLPREVVPQDFEVRNGDSEQLQSLPAAVTEPTANAGDSLDSSLEPEDQEYVAFTPTDGSADRLRDQALVCRSLLCEFLLRN